MQQLMVVRPSDIAVRLANDIYFTYLYNESPSLCIPFTRLCEVFGEADLTEIKHSVDTVFEELNEPIVLSECSIKGRYIEWEMLQYFTYSYSIDDGKVYVDLEVNERYLEALEILDPESYINFQ